ncbi:hypothetical protein INT48_006912 [Thamnidium elegans]|uniref:Uncharacterized protein n=1 Tax=Thamnidium elegans TaxID=101142 RepID=A0A8H7SJ16_9FUNG|nr:hypothetical protein INT48_006912 [Thamnidium elegans]
MLGVEPDIHQTLGTGVVSNPLLNELYSAAKRKGANALSNCGMYTLNREPVGLFGNDIIVGIDFDLVVNEQDNYC